VSESKKVSGVFILLRIPYDWIVLEWVVIGQYRKCVSGEYIRYRYEGYFWVSNLSKSKNSQNIFSGSKVALF
jgi:hypothetical protein